EQLAAEDLTHELLGETTQVEILADDAPSEGGTDAKLIETAPDLEPVDLDDEPTPAEVEVDVDPKE
ncbi:MAG TPA: hypothetical protein RMH26_04120, partial [Polyangiaceae bacterium LLY-WYZ-15_(1-7)]|nr:hypothetical protein [Polyangiaceae bacterium LLY-WYZ-15_(1-7)]